jgi:hypothetical protein
MSVPKKGTAGWARRDVMCRALCCLFLIFEQRSYCPASISRTSWPPTPAKTNSGTLTCYNLGIYFDERLNFNYHIDIAVNKALSMLGFIIRNARDFTNIEIFQLLFKTYVIPCLEYACLVWNPFYQCHVTSIEAVQRKFLIYLYFKVFGVFPLVGTHNHILSEQFNFLSLANRRKIIILLFLHKLIHYRIDCADLLQRLCFCIPRVNNRNVLPLHAAMPRSNTLLRAPIQSMSSLYNAVCKDFDIYYVSGCYFRKSLTIYFVNKS